MSPIVRRKPDQKEVTVDNAKQARILKAALRNLALRQAEAKTVKTKIRLSRKMAAIAEQLPPGWQKAAIEAEPELSARELAERQADAVTVKTKIRLGLKLAKAS